MPLSQTAMRFAGHLAYHDYEGPAFNRGERERLVADLGDKNAMILRNHGLLVCAPSIPQAFNLIYWLEQACKIQVDILSCGRPLHMPAHDVVEGTADALSGAEITLDNEDQHQSAHEGRTRRRVRPDTACSNGRRCAAGSTAWTRPTPSDRRGTPIRRPRPCLRGLDHARREVRRRDDLQHLEVLRAGDLTVLDAGRLQDASPLRMVRWPWPSYSKVAQPFMTSTNWNVQSCTCHFCTSSFIFLPL